MGPGAYLYSVPASQRTPRSQFKTTAGQLGLPNRKLLAMRTTDEVHIRTLFGETAELMNATAGGMYGYH